MNLFEACADINDKQIILYCSSQPKTEEARNSNSEKENVIDKLLGQLNRKDINEIRIGEKSIIPMDGM